MEFHWCITSTLLQTTPDSKRRYRKSGRDDALTSATVALLNAQAKQFTEHAGQEQKNLDLENSKLQIEHRRLDIEEKRLAAQAQSSARDDEDRKANRQFQANMMTALIDMMKRDK